MEYLYHLGVLFCISALLAESFNLSFGLGRSFNLAQCSFYAIGAYATALLQVDFGFPFWKAMICSALFPGLLAMIVSGIAMRLNEDYFAIGTLAFAALVGALLVNWKSLTRGVLGVAGIPAPGLEGPREFFWFALIVLVVCLAALRLLFSGQFPRALRAIAEHPVAAAGLGIGAAEARSVAFLISSMIAGIAGSVFAIYLSFIDPSSFGFGEMLQVLTIVILGGPGRFWGVLLATFVVAIAIPEGLRFLPLDSSILGPMRQLLNALFLFAATYLARNHLFPMRRAV